MFGFEYNVSTLVLIIFEFLLLFFQGFNYAARFQEKSRLRFLILIIGFLQFNILSGIMPDPEIAINLFIQNIIVYLSAIMLASYYFYYLVKELELPQLKIYNVKVLVVALFSSFVLLFFTTFLLSGNFNLSRKVFIIIPILISFYFCYQTVEFLIKKWRALKNKKTPYGTIIVAGNIGIVFMATMPVTDYFDENLDQELNIFLVNMSLVATFYAYIKNYIYRSKLEYEFLVNIGYNQKSNTTDKEVIRTKFKKYNLTSKELDVALMMLQGKSYKEIADYMFVVPKTVSKHASNIFKKTECSKKSEFISSFSTQGN